MIEQEVDITIIGAGVSGLILANEITERTNKKVLLLEKKKKFKFDKNLCYWSIPRNSLTDCADNRWSEICVLINKNKMIYQTKGIEYLRIKSSNFYNYFLNKLNKRKNFNLLLGHSINSVKSLDNEVIIDIGRKEVKSKICFDSRIENNYSKNQLLQHFFGVEIIFKKKVSNNVLTLMDIQNNKKAFNFFYILPMGENKVFIESTYFSQNFFKKEKYKNDINKYLLKNYSGNEYKIKFDEFGIIPMYELRNLDSKNHIKIGTAGNWVRQSTGYSLQNAFENSKQIVDCIIAGKTPKIKKKYFLNFLDKTFCKFLINNPEDGILFFDNFFRKNKLKTIVNFLTNTASLLELAKIIISLPKFKLIKTAIINK